MIRIEIKGNPIAKARPRFARRGRFVKTYNPQESEEGAWIRQAMASMPERPMEGPLSLRAWFDMPVPASWSARRQRMARSGEARHIKKPDLDNLVKFAKDCLNGIAWIDDSQVVEIVARKRFAAEYPRTTIEICEAT